VFRDDGEVTTSRPAKSRSVETTFDADVADVAALERTIGEQARGLAADASSRGIRGRTIGIKIRFADFETWTRARTLAEATADPEVVAATALALLAANRPPRPVRLVGVRLAGLEEGAPEAGQQPLVAI
jgi:DNA polymerase-4